MHRRTQYTRYDVLVLYLNTAFPTVSINTTLYGQTLLYSRKNHVLLAGVEAVMIRPST